MIFFQATCTWSHFHFLVGVSFGLAIDSDFFQDHDLGVQFNFLFIYAEIWIVLAKLAS